LILLLSSAGLSTELPSKHAQIQRTRAHSRISKPAAKPTAPLPAWNSLEEIGTGIAIVFSPDIARPANRQFYNSLGFLYIETANWKDVIQQIVSYNNEGTETPIQTVILETHGN